LKQVREAELCKISPEKQQVLAANVFLKFQGWDKPGSLMKIKDSPIE
jgi:hypothetical protein